MCDTALPSTMLAAIIIQAVQITCTIFGPLDAYAVAREMENGTGKTSTDNVPQSATCAKYTSLQKTHAMGETGGHMGVKQV